MTDQTAPMQSPAPHELGCDYWHPGSTLECRGDGFLWDADCDGYDPDDESSPCPQCNTLAYLLSAKEEAESVSESSSNRHYCTGVTLWEGAVEVARRANAEAAVLALRSIGKVLALYPDNTSDERFGTQEFLYGPDFSVKP